MKVPSNSPNPSNTVPPNLSVVSAVAPAASNAVPVASAMPVASNAGPVASNIPPLYLYNGQYGGAVPINQSNAAPVYPYNVSANPSNAVSGNVDPAAVAVAIKLNAPLPVAQTPVMVNGANGTQANGAPATQTMDNSTQPPQPQPDQSNYVGSSSTNCWCCCPSYGYGPSYYGAPVYYGRPGGYWGGGDRGGVHHDNCSCVSCANALCGGVRTLLTAGYDAASCVASAVGRGAKNCCCNGVKPCVSAGCSAANDAASCVGSAVGRGAKNLCCNGVKPCVSGGCDLAVRGVGAAAEACGKLPWDKLGDCILCCLKGVCEVVSKIH